MIVLKEPYTSLVLSRSKTVELRGTRMKKKSYYLADSATHRVKAFLTFGDSREIAQEEYERTFSSHRCEKREKPYKRTWATKITRVSRMAQEVSYRAKRGAVGYARYYSREM